MIRAMFLVTLIAIIVITLQINSIVQKIKHKQKVKVWAEGKESYEKMNRYSSDHSKIFYNVHHKQLKEFFDKYKVNDRISFSEFAMLVEAETDEQLYKKVNKKIYKVKYRIFKNSESAFDCLTDYEVFIKEFGSNAVGYSMYKDENDQCYIVVLCKRD